MISPIRMNPTAPKEIGSELIILFISKSTGTIKSSIAATVKIKGDAANAVINPLLPPTLNGRSLFA